MTQAVETSTTAPTPQERALGAFLGIIQGRCVVAAAELGVADALSDGPLPLDELARRTNANPDALFRMLRALESIGFFEQVLPRVFGNTPASDGLRKDAPGSQWAFKQIFAPGWVYWDGLTEMMRTLRTGKTAMADIWGHDTWEFYRRNPEQWPVFNEAMRSLNAPATPAITAAYDWGRFPVIADVAGGIGSQLVDILDAHPGSRGVLFDLPAVVSTAAAHDRIERVGGDFFTEIPVKADAYVLRNIIHDWNDEDALRILRTLRAATRPDARIMLVEWVISDAGDFQFGKWTDLIMMTAVGGRERTRAGFERLFKQSAFALEEIAPTQAPYSIVVGRPV
jgi:hypothetical protein